MQHHVDPAGDVQEVGHVAVHCPEAGRADEMGEISWQTREEVVHADHLGALAEQLLAQVGAEEPGAAGDHRPLYLAAAVHRAPWPRAPAGSASVRTAATIWLVECWPV